MKFDGWLGFLVRTKTYRRIAKTIIVLTGLLAIATGVGSYVVLGYDKGDTWTTIAGSLAVLAASLSAFTAQSVADEQADARAPSLELYFDGHSRIGLMLVVLRNVGISSAFNIEIKWEQQLRNANNEVIKFTEGDSEVEVAVLRAGEDVKRRVHGHAQAAHSEILNKVYRGSFRFLESNGKKYTQNFVATMAHMTKSLYTEEEVMPGWRAIQDIPDRLSSIQQSIQRSTDAIERYLPKLDGSSQGNEET